MIIGTLFFAAPALGAIAYIPWFDGTNYTENEILAVDIVNGVVLNRIPVGENPSGVAVSGSGELVFVANTYSNNVSVISARTLSVISTIPVGDRPLFVAPSTDGTRMHVGNVGDNTISIINVQSLKVTDIITISHRPYVIVEDQKRNRMLVSGSYVDDLITPIDLGNLQPQPPVAAPGSGLVVSADGSAIYAGEFDDVYKIDPVSLGVVGSNRVGPFVNELVHDHRNNKLYSAVSLRGVYVLDAENLHIINTLALPDITQGFGMAPGGTRGVAVGGVNSTFCFSPGPPCNPSYLDASIYVIDIDTQTVEREILLGPGGSNIYGRFFVGPNLYGVASTAVPIPTLTEWGMFLFVVLAGLGSIIALQKSQKAHN